MFLGRAMSLNEQNGPLSERKGITHFRPDGKGPVPSAAMGSIIPDGSYFEVWPEN